MAESVNPNIEHEIKKMNNLNPFCPANNIGYSIID